MKKTRLLLPIILLTLALIFSSCDAVLPEASTPISTPLETPPSTPSESVPSDPETNPYIGMSKDEFYANYTPAHSHKDALYRSEVGFLSGILELPEQYVTETANRPTENGKFVRNTTAFYTEDGKGYMILDSAGRLVTTVYEGGAYITLEEVAAYMYAFGGRDGSFPANYTSSKKTRPSESIWGEYLRVNHSYFKGDTNRYPYEPELPDISGCGGDLQYYEMDIGTTGTTTPGYAPKVYNNGTTITRGAARLVYARQDLNSNGVYEDNEVYVFYTHNHYNDFREYLNYYGGWGEVFGNITGGGTFDSKTDYNPTPYPETAYRAFGVAPTDIIWCDHAYRDRIAA